MPQDLTQELSERNAELTAQVASLTRALSQTAAVSQLVAGVVHDFQNALHVMLLETESLAETLDDARQIESARGALVAGRHAAAVARSLLALARKENPRTSLEQAAELVANLRPLIQRISLSRLECVFEIAPDTWPILVERQQLEAALINLSINARDAMRHGGTLRIRVHNHPRGASSLPPELPPGDYVRFCVEDTGVGMPPAVLARATEAFFTTKGPNHGTGLGLSMAQAFAIRFGGALRIESELERGTRVEILLPRAPVPQVIADDPARVAKLERLRARMRTPWLPHVLESWHAACSERGLPEPIAAEAGLVDHADCSLVLGVDLSVAPPALRLLRMGDTIARALGLTALGELAIEGSVALGSLGAAYRRALQSCFPSYEYVRCSFGEGSPAEFERLILPAASDGSTVSHLIGVVVLSNNLTAGE